MRILRELAIGAACIGCYYLVRRLVWNERGRQRAARNAESGMRAIDEPMQRWPPRPKRQVLFDGTVDAHLVGIVEHRGVVVGGHPVDEHHIATTDPAATQFGVAGGGAGEGLAGAVVAQELLHGGTYQAGVL